MQPSLFLLCIFLGFSSCSDDKSQKEISPFSKKQTLENLYGAKLEQAKERATKDGWLAVQECDAMLWTGKYSCAAGSSVVIEAAEYSDQPGRFNRRPTPFCEDGKGSQTSWSRDMGMGLMVYAWCNKDLKALERHAAYGKEHYWKMGEPLNDGRVVYTPSVIGELYQVIFALGGENSASKVWPGLYPSGQTDYQAHLQMLDIWLRGEVTKKTGEAPLLDISSTMYDRVKEHADREPKCPFFQFMLGVYDTGSLQTTADLLLGDEYKCDYYHTDDRNSDEYLAEWLFAAKLTLSKL